MSGQAIAGRLLRGRATRSRRRGFRLAVVPPQLRRRLIGVLALAVLLAAGYQFWLRDSPLVAVEEVAITGLTTKDAERVRAALASEARTMTTLHVEHGDLRQAIAAYPVVRALEVETDFPHGLAIRVIEHRPAALVGGLPVAGDGTVLRGLPVEGSLPEIASKGAPRGDRLTHPALLHAAHVAGGAPGALRPRLEQVEMRADQGIVVVVRDGPELIFGDASMVRAKWVAATRVLADPEAAGATYIDVRLPGRPAAGGLPAATLAPVDPAGTAELAPPIDPVSAAPGVEPTDPSIDPATAELAPAAPAPVTGTESPPPAALEAPAPAPVTPETVGGGAGPAP